MAKLIYSAIASLDGYIEDEEGNFDFDTASASDQYGHTPENRHLLWRYGEHLTTLRGGALCADRRGVGLGRPAAEAAASSPIALVEVAVSPSSVWIIRREMIERVVRPRGRRDTGPGAPVTRSAW